LDLAAFASNQSIQLRLFEAFGLGYMFGFSDVQLQHAEIVADADILSDLTIIHTKIFGISNGRKLIAKSLELQRDPEFEAGRTIGGNESLRSIADPRFVPDALRSYLLSSPM
jgi:hypothetical protein